MAFNEVLKEIRTKKGFTQQQVADALEITKGTYSGYETGRREPDVFKIKALAQLFDVSGDALLETGFNNEIKFTSEEKTHIKKYRTLDEHGKKLVDSVLNLECERVETTRTPVIPISNIITLSEFEQPVSAGKGVYLGDGSQTITREVPSNELTSKADFILRVSGDSMEPEFSNDDRILIKRQCDLKAGDIGIFILNGEGYVKKYMGDKLVSLNPDYKDIYFSEYDNIECKGLVLGKL